MIDSPAFHNQRSFVVYTPAGFMADWNRAKGSIVYTSRLDDAALFSLKEAHRAGLSENGAVLTAEGQLLTLTERIEE